MREAKKSNGDKVIEAPKCGNCMCFTQTNPNGERGVCNRFPQQVKRNATGHCFEHMRED